MPDSNNQLKPKWYVKFLSDTQDASLKTAETLENFPDRPKITPGLVKSHIGTEGGNEAARARPG